MLQELEIKDFALIHHLKVPFTAGLNVLTGETGAGKSIIIDALNAVLGGKVGPSVIRNGAERASAEASFLACDEVIAWLKVNELYDESFEGLIVSREVTKSGSKARINGTLVNIATVQELKQKLVTIHAQHEARTLQSAQAQLDMLDALGDDAHKKVLSQVRTLYVQRKELLRQLEETSISEDERTRRLDFSKFQLSELDDANLEDRQEDEMIASQVKVLANVVELEASIELVQKLLSGSEADGSPGALDLLQEAVVEVTQASQMDPELMSAAEAFNGCLETLDDQQRQLRKYKDRLDTDPETLANLESRLAQLATIKRKYGPSLAEAIERRDALFQEISRLENSQQQMDDLRCELETVGRKLAESAGKLSEKRKKLGKDLAEAIKEQLSQLGMQNCKFVILVDSLGSEGEGGLECGPAGIDRAEFLIAPNPGQPLAPVAKIASGGELSRVMLAVKTIFARADSVATVVFDEIEAGLSGKTLQSMRDKLATLAVSHQILCITHQPLIASVANNHIEVSKEQSSDTTIVSAGVLDDKQRLRAVAGMASGQDNQSEALKFAAALFADSARLRATLTP